MTCPECRAPLTLWGYAWAHVHPSPQGRFLGACIMLQGFIIIVMAFVRPL